MLNAAVDIHRRTAEFDCFLNYKAWVFSLCFFQGFCPGAVAKDTSKPLPCCLTKEDKSLRDTDRWLERATALWGGPDWCTTTVTLVNKIINTNPSIKSNVIFYFDFENIVKWKKMPPILCLQHRRTGEIIPKEINIIFGKLLFIKGLFSICIYFQL